MLMVVGLLAMLFVIVSAFITLARSDRVLSDRMDRAAHVDAILDSVNDLVRGLLRQQFTDANGTVFGGQMRLADRDGDGTTDYIGPAYEDIPGSGGSRVIGAVDPIFDFAATTAGGGNQTLSPLTLRLIPSSAGPLDATSRAIGALPLPGVSLAEIVATQGFLDPAGARPLFGFPPTPNNADLNQLARQPFMDADGDGIPDASFEHLAALHELANAIAGIIVQSPITDPYAPPVQREWPRWRRFDELARYEVAVRVVPHGGMVAFDSFDSRPFLGQGGPGSLLSNRVFIHAMFEWLAYWKGEAGQLRPNDPIFRDLAAERPAVEALLRRRGMLAAWRSANNPDATRMPDALRQFEKDFPRTLVSTFGRTDTRDAYRRFNVAADGDNELADWAVAAWAQPDLTSRQSILRDYDTRHLITTISNSDELARKLAPAPQGALPPDGIAGTYPGQLKFYLGRIASADPNTSAFNPSTGRYNPVVGNVYIRELANLFLDMLSAYEFPAATEALDRREQAIMLAVNTLAFAAPRIQSAPGRTWIDLVQFADQRGVLYTGYAPQPFITELVLHNGNNDDNPPTNDDFALALELYNPNEPLGTPDAHALDLALFAIGFDGADPNSGTGQGTTWEVVANVANAPAAISGRSVVALAIHPVGGNAHFDAAVGNAVFNTLVPAINQSTSELDPVTIKLWRLGTSAGWVLVDQLTVDWDDLGRGQPVFGDGEPFYVAAYRDLTDDGLFIPDASTGPSRPRWGAAIGEKAFDGDKGDPVGDPDPNRIVNVDLPRPGVDYQRFAPAPPLYTMNAGIEPNGLILNNGDARPTSFPTPGFMLFVPRFGHFAGRPVTDVLREQWNEQRVAYNYDPQVHRFPADFGHVPLFDNNQTDLAPCFEQQNGAGRLPWGLLLLDYVTTLDPARIPGGDPLRVPGRININAAPWHVLAGLPVIVPKQGDDLPFAPQTADYAKPSPAFWSGDAGVLVANTANERSLGRVRFTTDMSVRQYVLERGQSGRVPQTPWRRLGADLALAIAAYRDRAAYLLPNDPNNRYPFAEERNVTNDNSPRSRQPLWGVPSYPAYRNRLTYDRIRRERGTVGNADAPKYGFLTVAELLNVKGFDTAVKFTAEAQKGAAGGTFSEALHYDDDPDALAQPIGGPDFVRAVSLMALLDTQYLTTRSNTFTVYVTVRDRKNPQASIRSQITIDRSNTLPRLTLLDTNGDGLGDTSYTIVSEALPETIVERRIGYFNTVFDD